MYFALPRRFSEFHIAKAAINEFLLINVKIIITVLHPNGKALTFTRKAKYLLSIRGINKKIPAVFRFLPNSAFRQRNGVFIRCKKHGLLIGKNSRSEPPMDSGTKSEI